MWDGETLDNNEEGEIDYEFVAILQHRTKKRQTEQGEISELEYLVEFTPSDKDDNNVQWILESHLFDCDVLITKYWNEE